uniref:Rhodanese-like/PpiC domain-containing protein 12 n=1 Tax=Anthurium amnicola TaxID=1678845 RepID=A0A1D1ZKD2_9ARAE
MLRASSQRPVALLLSPPPYSSCNPRLLPLLSSSAPSKAARVPSLSLLPPARPQLCAPSAPQPSVARSLCSRTAPVSVTIPTQRAKGRVCFSAGGSEGSSKERLVQHLLVGEGDLKLLLEVQRKISEGVDLSDLAVQYSICPSKENGGMLGWVSRGQMVPEFEDAAFNAPVNKVVRCKTKFGWHLLQVLNEREESLLQDIGPEELHSKMQEPSFFEEAQLIDVREPDEVAKASLPGFKVLSLRQFGSWGSEVIHDFDPQKETFVLCHHGMRSLQVAQWLQTQGFKRVFNVAGGIHAYALKADPSIPTY